MYRTGGQSTWRPAAPATGVAGDEFPRGERRRGPSEQASTTTWIWPHLRVNTSPAGGPGGHCRYTQTGVPSPIRQGRSRSGAATTDHGSGPPRTGPEPPRAGPGHLQVEAGPPGGLSHQASGPPLPARAGVRSRHVPLWAWPPTPGSGAATCPTGADLRSPLGQGSGAATSPCGRGCRPLGPVPPHVPQSRVFCLKSALVPH